MFTSVNLECNLSGDATVNCYVIHLRPMCEPSVSSVPSLVSASPARAQSCRNHPQVDTQTYLVLSSTDTQTHLRISIIII